MQLRALIWDVDGTLAETERDGHRVAFNRAFEQAELRWHWDEQRYGELLRVTGGKERLRHYWMQLNPPAGEGGSRAEEPTELLAQLHALKTEHYLRMVRSGAITLRPGVARVLAEAREQGVRLAIATTTTLANVHELLRTTLGPEALRWFDCIAAGDVVERKKPAPDIYAWVLGRLALPARCCLALEDSAAGADAARALDIPVVITRSSYTLEEHVGRVCADLDSLGEPHAPAQGRAFGRRLRATVGLAKLTRWHERWNATRPLLRDLRQAARARSP